MNVKSKPSDLEETSGSQQNQMLPLDQCRAIMNQRGLQYTDDELLIVRTFLYRLAEIMTAYYERKKAKVIAINKTNDHDKTESIPLRPSEHRRAS